MFAHQGKCLSSEHVCTEFIKTALFFQFLHFKHRTQTSISMYAFLCILHVGGGSSQLFLLCNSLSPLLLLLLLSPPTCATHSLNASTWRVKAHSEHNQGKLKPSLIKQAITDWLTDWGSIFMQMFLKIISRIKWGSEVETKLPRDGTLTKPWGIPQLLENMIWNGIPCFLIIATKETPTSYLWHFSELEQTTDYERAARQGPLGTRTLFPAELCGYSQGFDWSKRMTPAHYLPESHFRPCPTATTTFCAFCTEVNSWIYEIKVRRVEVFTRNFQRRVNHVKTTEEVWITTQTKRKSV